MRKIIEIKCMKRTKSQMGKYARQKGHRLEREIAKEFRELGFPEAATTRQMSRYLDACGVDIFGVPFNIQAKYVKANIKYKEEIEKIENSIPEERKEYPTMVFHKKEDIELVVLRKSDFYKILNGRHRGEVEDIQQD